MVILLVCSFPVLAEEPLSPGEKIHIWVKGEPDLTVDRTVGSDGNVKFPLIGSVGVAGLTNREAAKAIAKQLDDGYLRNPLVQVDRIAGNGPPGTSPAPVSAAEGPPKVISGPLKITTGDQNFDYPLKESSRSKVKKPFRVDIVDAKAGDPVPNAVMLLNGKIYQSNRLGQLMLEASEGPITLLADGYQFIQGDLERNLRKGLTSRILMTKVAVAREISVKVVDAVTNTPLSDVMVRLDEMRVKTNTKGIFKIKEIVREFGELQLSKKGYRLIKRILDFKDPGERVISMVHE